MPRSICASARDPSAFEIGLFNDHKLPRRRQAALRESLFNNPPSFFSQRMSASEMVSACERSRNNKPLSFDRTGFEIHNPMLLGLLR
jgi:hypothetical protein